MSKPFTDNGVATAPEGEVLVVVTHAVLDNDARVPFDDYVDRLSDAMDADRYDGLLGYSIRKVLFGDEVWTLTVWRDERALRGFLQSGLHRDAIEAAPGAVVSLRSRHFTRPAADGPISWADALATFDRLEAANGGAR